MAVQSAELRNGVPGSKPSPSPPPHPRRPGWDWSSVVGQIAVWLMVGAFGGLFWTINGGFSVEGLRVVATAFNHEGALIWAALESIRFAVPVPVEGLPTTQPLIPWIAVVSSSLLQIVVLYRKLHHMSIPFWMGASALVLSIYDFGSTFFGLGTLVWVQQAGPVVQAILTFFLTFMVEAMIGVLLSLRR